MTKAPLTEAPYYAYYTFKGPPYACKAPPPHQFIFLVKFCQKAVHWDFFYKNLLQILFFGKIFAKISPCFCSGDCQHNSAYCLLFKWSSTKAWPKSVANYGEIYQ
jgi:hypothetical protein